MAENPPMGGMPPGVRAIVLAAIEEATGRGAAAVEASDLLLALTIGPGPVAEVLAEVGLDHDGLAGALRVEWEASLRYAGVAPLPAEQLAATPAHNRPRFGTSAREALVAGHRMLAHAAARRSGRRRDDERSVALGVLHAELGTVPRALELAGVDRRSLAARIRAL
ncbi:MAG TPA: hypothetical protein VFQ96_07370 [Microbacteriaceae bacterium]|nr:hypothetical protein [Microbacteriaceae bacterium]